MTQAKFLVLDFETRSTCDLTTQGTDNYALDPSTDLLCLCAAFNVPGENPQESLLEWTPADGNLPAWFVERLEAHLEDGGLVAAHNARFDQLIWECVAEPDYGFPGIPINAWYCTSAQCRVNALPAALENAALALKVKHKKNPRGSFLIRQLCIPDKLTGRFNENSALLAEMVEYCADDVLATIDVMNACRLLSPVEHADWLRSERINDFGIKIDRDLALLATRFAEAEAAELATELAQLTDGAVTKHTQHQRVKKWLLPKLSPDAEYLTVVHKDGQRKNSLDKSIRENLLGRADEGELELRDDAYNVIAALDEGSKSSVGKFVAMVNRADKDTHRVHGAFVYAGAATLRYSSRGLQLHNFRREAFTPEEADNLKRLMAAGEAPNAVMDTLSKLLRCALVPEHGKSLVVGDWSAIEARTLPWLADDARAEKLLGLIRATDEKERRGEKESVDLYVQAALDAGLEDRQIGKVIVLSLGYGGAVGAFNSMARNYGVFLPEHEVLRIVKAWRRKNQWAVDFWHKLERAAKMAIRQPGQTFTAGRVSYTFIEKLARGMLLCELPGGTYISYPDVRIEVIDDRSQITALKANWTPAAGETEWPRYKLYGGLFAENVTQATAAALLRQSLRQFATVALHCHDEIALEVPDIIAEEEAVRLQKVMETPPEWAQGLPLRAVPSIMKRYGKG